VHANFFGRIRSNQSTRGTCCVIVQMGVESPQAKGFKLQNLAMI